MKVVISVRSLNQVEEGETWILPFSDENVIVGFGFHTVSPTVEGRIY